MCRNEAPFQQFISQCILDIGSTSTEPAYDGVAVASGSNETGNPKSLLEMLLELEKKKETVEKSLESIGNDVKEGRTLDLADFANADEEWLRCAAQILALKDRITRPYSGSRTNSGTE